MSSVIHYKFRSAKEFDTFRFEGSGIPVWQLKEDVIESKKLAAAGGSSGDFGLVVSNAQTNVDYTDDSQIIPRNTSVVIRRVPLPQGAQKVGLARPACLPPALARPAEFYSSSTKPITPSSGEDAQIQRMIQQNAIKFDTASIQQASSQPRKPAVSFKPRPNTTSLGIVPPSTYTCHRCGLKGHYINFCPTNNDPNFDKPRIKRTTGIPKAFLKPIEGSASEARSSNPSATVMITAEGEAVIAQPNEAEWNRLVSTHSLPTSAETEEVENKHVPEDLRCANGGHLLSQDPVSPGCCKAHYCQPCIRHLRGCLVCKRSFNSNSSWLVDFRLKLKLEEFANSTNRSDAAPKDGAKAKETDEGSRDRSARKRAGERPNGSRRNSSLDRHGASGRSRRHSAGRGRSRSRSPHEARDRRRKHSTK